MSKEDFISLTSSQSADFKTEIISYMRKFEPCAYTSSSVYDKLTDEKVFEADNAHSDGIYTWYEDEIYHFEKYNIKLNNDFIQHVLNQK